MHTMCIALAFRVTLPHRIDALTYLKPAMCDLAGYEDMSVLNYFKLHGYSLAYVRKSPKRADRVVHSDRILNADRVVHSDRVLNVDRATGPPTPAQQAQLQPTHSQLTQTEHKPQALDTTVTMFLPVLRAWVTI